jgi:hypothetical protein
VIGRRLIKKGDTQRCQYLIRNTYGADFKYYSADWESDNGNIWIDADHLLANSYGLSYLR